MIRPALSVIVPIYNGEKYIDQCLASLTGQTLHNIEIICVDDGSQDAGVHILNAWAQKDARITIIRQEHAGVSAARNAGLNAARAPLITFADMDDSLACQAYERAVEKMTDEVDWVCFGIEVVQYVNNTRIVRDEDYYRLKYKGKVEPSEEVLLKTDCSPCNKIFRKSIIESRRISFPVNLHYEDAYFCRIYGLFCRAVFFMEDKFYFYLRHEGSIMDNTFRKRAGLAKEHLYIAFLVYRYLKENNLFLRYKHYFGEFFFGFVDLALQYSKPEESAGIYDEACGFLERENISFAEFARLNHVHNMLKKRIRNTKIKKWAGLLRIYYTEDSYKVSFLGITLVKRKFTDLNPVEE